MIKKTILTFCSLSLLALGACSDNTPEITEKLRKVGSPIEGIWHVTDLETCETGKQSATIYISKTAIEKHDTATDEKTVVLNQITKSKSSRYLLLSGKKGEGKDLTTLAYADKGDKLEFSGFIKDNKLLTRAKILENYNADGNALKNIKRYDYVFCNRS